MDPVEINAGSWYLRALRADERVDDSPALAAAGISDPGYVALRLQQWAADELYSWAVCVPETGEMVAEIQLSPQDGHHGPGVRSEASPWALSGWAATGYDGALADGLAAVRRFAESGLGLVVDGEWPS